MRQTAPNKQHLFCTLPFFRFWIERKTKIDAKALSAAIEAPKVGDAAKRMRISCGVRGTRTSKSERRRRRRKKIKVKWIDWRNWWMRIDFLIWMRMRVVWARSTEPFVCSCSKRGLRVRGMEEFGGEYSTMVWFMVFGYLDYHSYNHNGIIMLLFPLLPCLVPLLLQQCQQRWILSSLWRARIVPFYKIRSPNKNIKFELLIIIA